MTTFSAGGQTHQAVLPQQPALELVRADTPGSRDETAHGHPATIRGTGAEHGRGETRGSGTSSRRRHAAQAETGGGDTPQNEQPQTYAGGTGDARVFVLSKDGQPLMPCHPARARELLSRKRAVVARHSPFTIRLKDRTRDMSTVDGVQVRIDPGSKGTGIAVTDTKGETDSSGRTVTVRRGLITIELQHRGAQIHKSMGQRAGYRRRRRSTNCRYRARRSTNRARPYAWLAPSLRHRVDSTFSIINRLCRYAPVSEIHVEWVAFDTRALSESESVRGTLAGAEVRAYLLAKWGRSCAYCGATGVPLNVEHILARSRGGSNRISNLTLACVPCNQAKGAGSVTAFLADRPSRLAAVLQQTQVPLRDAAAMNTTRRQLAEVLRTLGLPVHVGSGARTGRNRSAMGLAKSHTLDALCVGVLDHENGDRIVRIPRCVRIVKATGRGSYARTTPDRHGFPRLRRPRRKRHHGFATGDLVRASVPTGRWKGIWTAHVAARTTGQHSLTTPMGRFNVSHVNLQLLQRADGYAYSRKAEVKNVLSRSP